VSAGHPELGPEAARARLASLRVIDVREDHEWTGPLGRIPGAEHRPLGRLASHLDDLRGDRTLLLVCRSGKRSGIACARLLEQGFAAPTNLAGGMIAWRRAGLPVERDRARSLAELLEIAVAWLAQVTGTDRAPARARLARWLEQAGGSLEDPTPAAVQAALGSLEAHLRESGAPPDLDLTLTALRSDLAAL
jgi:rhodanese-related sulfurtransferase